MLKKTKKMIVASAIALGLAAGLAACAPAEPTASAEDVKAITEVYTTFVDGVLAIDTKAATDLYASLEEKYASAEPTDTTKQEIIDQFKTLAPDTFALIKLDGLSADEQGSALGGLVGVAVGLEGAEISIKIPATAIKVEGDKATIDRSQIEVSYDQGTSTIEPRKLTAEQREALKDVKLIKVDGKWLISSTEGLFSEILG